MNWAFSVFVVGIVGIRSRPVPPSRLLLSDSATVRGYYETSLLLDEEVEVIFAVAVNSFFAFASAMFSWLS